MNCRQFAIAWPPVLREKVREPHQCTVPRCADGETASRFSRDLVVQETGFKFLTEKGFTLIAVDSPQSFLLDTPSSKMIRQILGSVSEFQKDELVAKLRAARDRKRQQTGKCEGRKGFAETNPQLLKDLKRLYRKNPATKKRRSLRDLSLELTRIGYSTRNGTPISPGHISRLLKSF